MNVSWGLVIFWVSTIVLALGLPLFAEHQARFLRGDPNASGRVDISDGIFVLNYLFQGAETPTCLDAADANDSGRVDISDAITLFGFLFLDQEPSKKLID